MTSLAVFAAVWTGSCVLGRAGGVGLGWAVVILGVVRDSLAAAPAFLREPVRLLVPNLGILWSGDLFYADVLTLPWSFVGYGCLYLAVWSSGAILVGMTVSLAACTEGLRGTDLRT